MRSASRPASPGAPAGSRRRSRGRPGGSPPTPGRRGRRAPAACPCRRARAAPRRAAPCRAAGTSSSSASSCPPPSPKIVKRSPLGVVKPDMFSITPSSSRSTFAGHVGGAPGDRLRGRLRRGDDDHPRLREQLGERHRDVAGPRRQVEQQVVELVPGDVLEELLDRLVEHRPAPDDGRVRLEEEADRHHLHPGGVDRRDDLALAVDVGPLVDAEHARDRVAVDVGVERAGRCGPRPAARRRGWRSSSTCRRRPCRRRCRSRS